MKNTDKVIILIVYATFFSTIWIMTSTLFFENLREVVEDEQNSIELIAWARTLKGIKLCSCDTCIKEYTGLFMEQHFMPVKPFLAPDYNFTEEDFTWWRVSWA